MPYVRRVGEKGHFYVIDSRRGLGRECFQPGSYEIRGATGAGTRNTGVSRLTCLCNAYRGCPNEDQEGGGWSAALVAERKKEGWKPT